MFHMLHFQGQGAGSMGQEVSSCAPFSPLFIILFYSLAPCPLLLAPFETEQAQFAKVELII